MHNMSNFILKLCTAYPKKYAHGFCFAVLCCGYTLTDFPISIRLTSLALWQSNDCPSASKATLMNMDKYFMWIHYERLHNHNKAKHNKTVCIFLGIYCIIRALNSMQFSLSRLVNEAHINMYTIIPLLGGLVTVDLPIFVWKTAMTLGQVPLTWFQWISQNTKSNFKPHII